MNKKISILTVALIGGISSSHGIVLQIVGMDTNTNNLSASGAAGTFDSIAGLQAGGSSILDLDSLSAIALTGSTVNLGGGVTVDASGNTGANLQSGSFSTNVSGIVLSSSTGAGDLVFNFATPTTHFGFYNQDFNTVPSGFNIVFDEGQGVETINIDTALGGDDGEGFFGLVFDNAVSTLTLQGTGGGDFYVLDNFRVTPVPEPSAFALVAGFLGLCMSVARRRRVAR